MPPEELVFSSPSLACAHGGNLDTLNLKAAGVSSSATLHIVNQKTLSANLQQCGIEYTWPINIEHVFERRFTIYSDDSFVYFVY